MTGRRDEAVARLTAILAAEGPTAFNDPLRLRGLISDRLAGMRHEVPPLIAALEANIPQQIRSRASSPIEAATQRGWETVLVKSGLDAPTAAFAVSAWMTALGLAPTVTRDPIPGRPEAVPWYRRPLVMAGGAVVGLVMAVAAGAALLGGGDTITPSAPPSLAIFETETDPPEDLETDPPEDIETAPPVDVESDPPPDIETDPPVDVESDPPTDPGDGLPASWPADLGPMWSAFAPVINESECTAHEGTGAAWLECYHGGLELSGQYVVWRDVTAEMDAQPTTRDGTRDIVDRVWQCNEADAFAEWRFYDGNDWLHSWSTYLGDDANTTVEVWSVSADAAAIDTWFNSMGWCEL